jgi:hypothetical protein
MTFDRKAAEDRFEAFLMALDDQVDWLVEQGQNLGIDLDLSPNDLPKLELLFDRMTEHADKDHVSRLVITFARHLGEILRQNHGGQWHLSLDDSKNANFDTPVIIGHTPIKDLEFAPLSVMRAYALRRKPGTLQRAIDAQVVPKPLDLSGLVEG